MGKQLFLLLAVLMLSFGSASAALEDTLLEPAGITPSNPFYGLDVAIDNARIAVLRVFNPQESASRAIRVSEERTAEIALEAAALNPAGVERAVIQREVVLGNAEDFIDEEFVDEPRIQASLYGFAESAMNRQATVLSAVREVVEVRRQAGVGSVSDERAARRGSSGSSSGSSAGSTLSDVQNTGSLEEDSQQITKGLDRAIGQADTMNSKASEKIQAAQSKIASDIESAKQRDKAASKAQSGGAE